VDDIDFLKLNKIIATKFSRINFSIIEN